MRKAYFYERLLTQSKTSTHRAKQIVKNYLFRIPQKIRFLLVGGLNTAISYGMFAFFLFLWGDTKHQAALAMSWVCSSFISFSLQKILVFQSQGNWLREYIRCILSWSIAYAINAILLELSTAYLQMNPFVAQLLALCCTTVITYFLFKNFAFKK